MRSTESAIACMGSAIQPPPATPHVHALATPAIFKCNKKNFARFWFSMLFVFFFFFVPQTIRQQPPSPVSQPVCCADSFSFMHVDCTNWQLVSLDVSQPVFCWAFWEKCHLNLNIDIGFLQGWTGGDIPIYKHLPIVVDWVFQWNYQLCRFGKLTDLPFDYLKAFGVDGLMAKKTVFSVGQLIKCPRDN